jgi:hypothetical protein
VHHHYADIRRLTDCPPIWFDEYAVPRYCAFAPDQTANIYAKEACLYEIACQSCGRRFIVCDTWSTVDEALRGIPRLSEQIRAHDELSYGDPPNVECCPAGPTMTSEPVRVLEFWRREKSEWRRVAELEGDTIRPAFWDDDEEST